MNRATQSVGMAFLGAILVRITVTSEYLRFVQGWMRWPVLLTGVLLLGIAAYPLLDLRRGGGAHEGHEGHEDDGHGHGALTRTAWLLFLPGLVIFLISPPPLGAYLAERRAGDSVAAPPSTSFAPLPAGDPVELDVYEFLWRAATGGGQTVRDRQVRLTGFVSTDDDAWFVTRVTIRCCAADAIVSRIKVDGLPAPARDSWVAVTGTLASATDGDASSVVLTGAEATPVPAPKDPYQ